VQLVWISNCISDIADRKGSQFQQFGSFGHTVGNQEFLWGFSHIFAENLSEITPVQTTGSGNIFYGNIILEILLNKGKRFLNIEVPQAAAPVCLSGGRGVHQAVYEQIKMAD